MKLTTLLTAALLLAGCAGSPIDSQTEEDLAVQSQALATVDTSIVSMLNAIGATTPVHLVTLDGLVAAATDRELEVTGYAGHADEYVGHPIAEFHASQPVIAYMLATLLGQGPGRRGKLLGFPAELKRRDGSTFWVLIDSSIVPSDAHTYCQSQPVDSTTAKVRAALVWPAFLKAAAGQSLVLP
jgi:hypothetical protein